VTGFEIGAASVVAILVLIYLGMHVGIALCIVSVVGVWAVKGSFELGTKLLALAAYDAVAGYVFGVVPLFVLMGLFISVSDIGRDTFDAANVLFRRVRGGLGIATVSANAVFAAVTGISVASAAVFTRVAIPEMIRLGYRPRFAVGVVAGSSVLGMLIPPSLLLIVFALLAEQSVGDLFIAGIVPGLVLAGAFAIGILCAAYFLPHRVRTSSAAETEEGGRDEQEHGLGWAAAKLAPLAILVIAIIGGIYAGWFTPTESGAVGAAGAMVLALARRKLDWQGLWRVLVETGHISVAILFLIIAANIYSRLLALTGMPAYLESWVTQAELGFLGLMLIYTLVLLAMGTLLDAVSIMLIMVPMVLPMLAPFDVNLVWFGIVTVIAVEIGLLTPPLGLSAYVIKSTLDDQRISLFDIFAGAAPYALIMLAVLALIVAWPGLTLVLL